MSESDPQGGQVDIDYALFTNDSGELLPVSSPTDRELEAALKAADPYRRIELANDPVRQSMLLHRHVLATLFDFANAGHTVALADGEDSRWDRVTRRWIEIRLGASRAYPVVDVATGERRLWINVWTVGATADGAAEASA